MVFLRRQFTLRHKLDEKFEPFNSLVSVVHPQRRVLPSFELKCPAWIHADHPQIFGESTPFQDSCSIAFVRCGNHTRPPPSPRRPSQKVPGNELRSVVPLSMAASIHHQSRFCLQPSSSPMSSSHVVLIFVRFAEYRRVG